MVILVETLEATWLVMKEVVMKEVVMKRKKYCSPNPLRKEMMMLALEREVLIKDEGNHTEKVA